MRTPNVLSYFAYGSNMNLGHLRSYLRRFGVEADGVADPRRAVLHNLRLRTNYYSSTHAAGACNIEPAQGAVVEGLVMSIRSPALEAIMNKEGWPGAYIDLEIAVQLDGEKDLINAITFVVHPHRRLEYDLPVTQIYRNLILTAAQDSGLSKSYQQQLRHVLRLVKAGDRSLIRNVTA